MEEYFLTLDPGKKGAVVLFQGRVPIEGYVMESQEKGIDSAALLAKLTEWDVLYGIEMTWLECITPRPGQSAQATATQFFVLGQTVAALRISKLPFTEVYPQTWTSFTKRLLPGFTGDSKALQQWLAPNYFKAFAESYRKRKLIQDGIADCLGISLWVNRDYYVDTLTGGDFKWAK